MALYMTLFQGMVKSLWVTKVATSVYFDLQTWQNPEICISP